MAAKKQTQRKPAPLTIIDRRQRDDMKKPTITLLESELRSIEGRLGAAQFAIELGLQDLTQIRARLAAGKGR